MYFIENKQRLQEVAKELDIISYAFPEEYPVYAYEDVVDFHDMVMTLRYLDEIDIKEMYRKMGR